jgi:hypothetical protein
MATEADVADLVADRYRKLGYRVHAEVVVTNDGRSFPIDMVAAKPTKLVAIECKLKLSHDLLDQCIRALTMAHEVWAAVREPKNRSRLHGNCREVLKRKGIGLLYVRPELGVVAESIMPAHRGVDDRVLRAALCDRQESDQPGKGAGKRHRADKWERARRLLKSQGRGMTARELGLWLEWAPTLRRQFTKAVVQVLLGATRGRSNR